MKTLHTPLIALCALLVTACATTPELSRDEQLKLQEVHKQYFDKWLTRAYPTKSKDEVLKAAQKVLVLSDGDDVSFVHNETGFVANRKWSWYAVMAADRGVDQWTFKINPEPTGGVKVSLTENTISTQYNQQSTYVYGVGVMNLGPATTTNIEHYNEENAIYTLFWRRMDYLLGLTKTWTTCDAYAAELKTSTELKGNIKPLCGVLAKDDLPEELRVTK